MTFAVVGGIEGSSVGSLVIAFLSGKGFQQVEPKVCNPELLVILLENPLMRNSTSFAQKAGAVVIFCEPNDRAKLVLVLRNIKELKPTSLIVSPQKDDLDAAVAAWQCGQTFFTHKAAEMLIELVRHDTLWRKPDSRGLSPREIETLRLIASGKKSKEIATILNLSPETVRTYRKTLMNKLKKLGVGGALGATQWARDNGFGPDEA